MLVRPGRSSANRDVARTDPEVDLRAFLHVDARADHLPAVEGEVRDAGLGIVARNPHADDGPRVQAPRVASKVETVRYLLDGPVRNDPPGAHQHQVRCEAHHLVDLVAHVQGGDLELPGETLDEGKDVLLAVLVERGEGLIHQEEARVREHRTRERDPLALAAREGGHAPPEEGLEVHETDHRLRPEQSFAGRGAPVSVENVSLDREVGKETRVLEDEARPAVAGGDERSFVLPRRPVEGDPSPRFPLEPRDRPQEGGLAAARGPEDRGDPGEGDIETRFEAEVATNDDDVRHQARGARSFSGRHERESAD